MPTLKEWLRESFTKSEICEMHEHNETYGTLILSEKMPLKDIYNNFKEELLAHIEVKIKVVSMGVKFPLRELYEEYFEDRNEDEEE